MAEILILEDDKEILEMLSSELEELGFTVVCTTTCTQASNFFNLCKGFLSDGELPDGRGLDSISKFKKLFPNKPAILLSGNSEIVQQAVKLDFVDLALSKSNEIESNLKKIEKLFNQFKSTC